MGDLLSRDHACNKGSGPRRSIGILVTKKLKINNLDQL